MLTIRMRRLGAKKRPFFRVVVTETRTARDGRSLEVLGYYDPARTPETFHVNRERVDYWVTRGAQPSDTVRTLLARNPTNTPVVAAETVAPVSEPAPVPAAEPAPATDAEESAAP